MDFHNIPSLSPQDIIINALALSISNFEPTARTNLAQTNKKLAWITKYNIEQKKTHVIGESNFNSIFFVLMHYNEYNIVDITPHIPTIQNHVVLDYIGKMMKKYYKNYPLHTIQQKSCTIALLVQHCATNNYTNAKNIHFLITMLREHFDYTDNSIQVLFQHCLNLKHYHIASLIFVKYAFVRKYWLDSIIDASNDRAFVNKIREIQFFDKISVMSYGEIFVELWDDAVDKSIVNFLFSQIDEYVLQEITDGNVREIDYNAPDLIKEVEYFVSCHLFSLCTLYEKFNVMPKHLEEYFNKHIPPHIMHILKNAI